MKLLKRIHYNAPVTLTFALICLVVLGLNKLTGGWTNLHLFMTYRSRLTDPLMYIRLFGHAIGHAVKAAVLAAGIGVTDATIHVEPDEPAA